LSPQICGVSTFATRPGDRLDLVTVGVEHVHTIALALCPKQRHRPSDDDVLVGRHEFVEELSIAGECEVVNVRTIGLARKQVDDELLAYPDRREWSATAAPLVETHWFETELVDVPGQRRLDIGGKQNNVVDSGQHGAPSGRGG